MFFFFANIIHSYLDFLFTTLFGFKKKNIICSMDYISDLSFTNLPAIISFVCVSKAVNNQTKQGHQCQFRPLVPSNI